MVFLISKANKIPQNAREVSLNFIQSCDIESCNIEMSSLQKHCPTKMMQYWGIIVQCNIKAILLCNIEAILA